MLASVVSSQPRRWTDSDSRQLPAARWSSPNYHGGLQLTIGANRMSGVTASNYRWRIRTPDPIATFDAFTQPEIPR